MTSTVTELAYLTRDLPGCGGRIKERPEDFIVEEIPIVEPIGHGEYLHITLEKRGVTTSDMVRRVARLLNVPRSDVSYAGLKDKHAVTRQALSVHLPSQHRNDPGLDTRRLELFDLTPFTLLRSARHTQCLRRGQLRGNRFDIRIRDVNTDDALQAQRIVDRLVKVGVPNYIGLQRFGYRRTNHDIGKLLVLGQWQAMLDLMLGSAKPGDSPAQIAGRDAYDRGDYLAALDAWPKLLRHDRQALDALRQRKSAEEAVRSIDRQQLDFYLAAFQSHIFNRVLDRRLRADDSSGIDQFMPGDLAWNHADRTVFEVKDESLTRPNRNTLARRAHQMELSPSGPMWGVTMTRASQQPGQWEHEALSEMSITPAQLAGQSTFQPRGSRRPLRERLIDPVVSSGIDDQGPYIRITFQMNRGCFATVALREIMKVDV